LLCLKEMLSWTRTQFLKLIELLEEDAGEKCVATFIYSKLHIRSSENEVIIRCTEVINEIAISGVCFKNHRKGYLTCLISLLKDYGRENDYKVIKLERCNEKSANYAKKHGFKQHYMNTIIMQQLLKVQNFLTISTLLQQV